MYLIHFFALLSQYAMFDMYLPIFPQLDIDSGIGRTTNSLQKCSMITLTLVNEGVENSDLCVRAFTFGEKTHDGRKDYLRLIKFIYKLHCAQLQ